MRTVLVVDDDERIRELVCATLENRGCRVLAEESGIAALQTARRERPDLILMDCRLRGLSGAEVLRLLRADARTVGTPVILMSGFTSDEMQPERHLLQANGFLLKPFRPVQLLVEMQYALQAAPAVYEQAAA